MAGATLVKPGHWRHVTRAVKCGLCVEKMEDGGGEGGQQVTELMSSGYRNRIWGVGGWDGWEVMRGGGNHEESEELWGLMTWIHEQFLSHRATRVHWSKRLHVPKQISLVVSLLLWNKCSQSLVTNMTNAGRERGEREEYAAPVKTTSPDREHKVTDVKEMY